MIRPRFVYTLHDMMKLKSVREGIVELKISLRQSPSINGKELEIFCSDLYIIYHRIYAYQVIGKTLNFKNLSPPENAVPAIIVIEHYCNRILLYVLV